MSIPTRRFEGRVGRYLTAMTIALLALTLDAAAQKRSNIELGFTAPPADMKTGDVVETTITFEALVDIDRLAVEVYPFNGVEVMSEPTNAAFGPIKKGDSATMKVKVRLTAAKFGSLTVSMETQVGDTRLGEAKTIVYGNPNR